MPFDLNGQAPPAPGPRCPVDCAVSTIGSRPSLLLLRQAFYGDRRFDAFVRNTGMSEATTAKRLQQLTEAGVLRKIPYQEPGDRLRAEYELTAAGEELLPVIVGLFSWARNHLGGVGADVLLVDPREKPVHATVCTEDGQELTARDIRVRVSG